MFSTLKVKVKVKVKGHVIRALSWILGMSYSVIDGLVMYFFVRARGVSGVTTVLSKTSGSVLADNFQRLCFLQVEPLNQVIALAAPYTFC